ncbi:Mu transposase C-terminal domain-containing protein [Schinkia azotoformans]|uniref:Mu transposase C-terminal domain-containing protein n=1 Tax=Schinkia azotoformans TaxID=1454 RepID=UPI002DB59F74|nr:Mu transposase C-terminal domain-containing protein [Schinkia azotoformans]MEC1698146.1 DDE-type integrase/transposase/recombinase [Schinkia azotoformans]MEC1714793.1 DDE-type integrase/transposase/recombinase [Schinkia azotoformans]MEC1727094.1 DDE-type integrase/transposase/recombinase [Schinkia azotoformans]MEC1742285.1 DDE-type integrase/transposase/recombinase [Schinkia azotoformans]MEC1768911.1 DDE-type integrase/transposase/recombinase [Schinkia azotoformans]
MIDINDEKALPFVKKVSEIKEEIVSDQLNKTKNDPFLYLSANEELPEKYLEIRDQAWNVIKDMVNKEPKIFDKKVRSFLTNEAMKLHNVTYPAVRKYLRKYWQRGKMINALLPDYSNSGAKGKERKPGEKKRGRPRKYSSKGINVDDKVKKVFRVALEKYYLTTDENNLTHAYKMMIKEFYADDVYYENGVQKVKIKDEDKLPSINQFKYWYEKEYSISEATIARKGVVKAEKEYRAILNNSLSEVHGPGSRFQIDATVADVYLISKFNSNWIIGRPIIYIVIDVFSRMVAGIHIGLEGPSWLGAMMALANTVTDKQKFCAKYGIDISKEDWPCEHLPDVLLADRGEFEGYNVNRLIEAFNMEVENAAPYRADWKGIVEKHFDLIQKKVKPFLPGYVDTDFQERGARDYRLDAVLTLEEFTKIILKQIVYYNKKHYLKDYIREQDMINDEVVPRPLDLWNWGIKNRSGKLRYHPEELVSFHLLPREQATVTEKGIKLKGMYYSCETAMKERWFETSRQKGSWKTPLSYDPRNMNYVFFIDQDTKQIEKCHLLPGSERYQNTSLDEIIYLQEAEKKMFYENQHEQLQKDIDYITEIEKIVEEAVKRKKKTMDNSLSKLERVSSIQEYRKQEKDHFRKEEFLKDSTNTSRHKNEVIPINMKELENEEQYARTNIRDFLKKRKEKKDE